MGSDEVNILTSWTVFFSGCDVLCTRIKMKVIFSHPNNRPLLHNHIIIEYPVVCGGIILLCCCDLSLLPQILSYIFLTKGQNDY